ncbi:outer membrane beta-barrel protein [Rheinheimera soli]|uniref:DUF560 domain-containing protein n=1 Tax=Rheinheimera soli TaxID=443616 RepID=A0ABU1VWH3_9GAMM|nr:outer membrane beta-barrel protein [Rheinheimera soli]MDR7120080.1 hypothetical protein [Rheinheimera soli]
MKPLNYLLCLPLTSMLGLAPAGAAELSEQTQVSGYLSYGQNYNSNLKTAELDNASGRSAAGQKLEAQLALRWKPTEQWTLDLGYTHQQNRWQDNSDFNTTLGLWALDLSYQAKWLTLGGTVHKADAELASEDFLGLEQYSLYLAKLWLQRYYVRISLNQTDKDFKVLDDRDAKQQQLRSDLFVFSADQQGFVQLGLAYQDEQTQSELFDFRGPLLQLKASQQWRWLEQDHKLQLGWQWQHKDYQMAGEAEKRQDRINSWQLNWQWQLNHYLALTTQLEHQNSASNVPTADYSQNLAGMALRLSF